MLKINCASVLLLFSEGVMMLIKEKSSCTHGHLVEFIAMFRYEAFFKQMFLPTQETILNRSGCVTPTNDFPTCLSTENFNIRYQQYENTFCGNSINIQKQSFSKEKGWMSKLLVLKLNLCDDTKGSVGSAFYGHLSRVAFS